MSSSQLAVLKGNVQPTPGVQMLLVQPLGSASLHRPLFGVIWQTPAASQAHRRTGDPVRATIASIGCECAGSVSGVATVVRTRVAVAALRVVRTSHALAGGQVTALADFAIRSALTGAGSAAVSGGASETIVTRRGGTGCVLTTQGRVTGLGRARDVGTRAGVRGSLTNALRVACVAAGAGNAIATGIGRVDLVLATQGQAARIVRALLVVIAEAGSRSAVTCSGAIALVAGRAGDVVVARDRVCLSGEVAASRQTALVLGALVSVVAERGRGRTVALAATARIVGGARNRVVTGKVVVLVNTHVVHTGIRGAWIVVRLLAAVGVHQALHAGTGLNVAEGAGSQLAVPLQVPVRQLSLMVQARLSSQLPV